MNHNLLLSIIIGIFHGNIKFDTIIYVVLICAWIIFCILIISDIAIIVNNRRVKNKLKKLMEL